MKKSFSINAKGTVANLLQSISLKTTEVTKAGQNLLLIKDPTKSCYAMEVTQRQEISLL